MHIFQVKSSLQFCYHISGKLLLQHWTSSSLLRERSLDIITTKFSLQHFRPQVTGVELETYLYYTNCTHFFSTLPRDTLPFHGISISFKFKHLSFCRRSVVLHLKESFQKKLIIYTSSITKNINYFNSSIPPENYLMQNFSSWSGICETVMIYDVFQLHEYNKDLTSIRLWSFSSHSSCQ